jgi:O-antigen/teichoic acid export membrane protein
VPSTEYNLGKRTLTGMTWLFISRFSQKTISLIQFAFLARFLDPMVFGLMDLANISTVSIGIIIYTGFEFAIIQKIDLKEIDIHTAWWTILGRFLVLGVSLLLLSAPITKIYNAPEAFKVLIAFGLMQPILGLISPSPILFKKDLQFHKLFKIEVGSALISLFVGSICIFMVQSVWTLVISLLSAHISYLVLSYILHPYRPKLQFDYKCFKEFSSYGRWVLGSNIFWFVCSQGASAFSGWMFGVAALGLFQMAARFALFPANHLNDLIQSGLAPSYSIIQENKVRLSQAFLRVMSLASVLIFGITIIVALGLPSLLVIVLGDRWFDAGALVPSIAIAGGAQALLRIGYPLFLGTGRPKYQFFIDGVQAIVMALLFFPLGKIFGMPGLAYAMTVGAICAIPLWWFGIKKSTNCLAKDVIVTIIPAVLGVLIVTIVFFLGQTTKTDLISKSIIGTIWDILIIVIAAVTFVKTISVGQKTIPNYLPLEEIKMIIRDKL